MNILESEDVIITGRETTNSKNNLAWWESQGYSKEAIIYILMDSNHPSRRAVSNFFTNSGNPDRERFRFNVINLLSNEETFAEIHSNFSHPNLKPDTPLEELPDDVLNFLLEQVFGWK